MAHAARLLTLTAAVYITLAELVWYHLPAAARRKWPDGPDRHVSSNASAVAILMAHVVVKAKRDC